jgi:hypothetical protein
MWEPEVEFVRCVSTGNKSVTDKKFGGSLKLSDEAEACAEGFRWGEE